MLLRPFDEGYLPQKDSFSQNFRWRFGSSQATMDVSKNRVYLKIAILVGNMWERHVIKHWIESGVYLFSDC